MSKRMALGFAAVAMMAVGCATAPDTVEGKQSLIQDAQSTLATMQQRDPELGAVLQSAHAYAVFPDVGKGGVIVGGAYGRGVVFQNGQPIGFTELNQASIGAQLGGQTFAELIVFQTPQALQRFQGGNFDLGADVSAVALTKGAAAQARFNQGIGVFVMPHGGLMVDVSISGQKFNYQPRG